MDRVRVIDFAVDSPADWFVVNDTVMGGRSSGALNRAHDGVAVFEGRLSLENNGGFTTVRRDIAEGALEGAARLLVRVRSDGKRYQLRLHPGHHYDGVAFAADFEAPAGEWTTVALPLAVFEPTFRGRRPAGVGPLDPSGVGQVGIMIKDRQAGPFRLEIEWIGVER